ncbi:MAG: hypothetical protein IMF11_12615 [Proteobacteria bacterium]|nr:hypothetical protein [Pseudomonadota bacterium]MCK4485406.1 hypothetical protein [Desulfobacterales bacterium]
MKVEIADENRLKDLIREAVRDVLEEEVMKVKLLLTPYVSDEEQREIEESYGQPSKQVARTLVLEE